MRNLKSPHTIREFSGNCIERKCHVRSWSFSPLCVPCSVQYWRTFIILLLQIKESVQGEINGSNMPDKENAQTDKMAHINGYLHVTSYPPILHVTLGKTAVGYVNISLGDSILSERQWIPTARSSLNLTKSIVDRDENHKHIDPKDRPANLHKTKLSNDNNDVSKTDHDSNSLLPETGAETQQYIVTTGNISKQALIQEENREMTSHNEANKNFVDIAYQNNLGAKVDKVNKLETYRTDYSRIISSIGITSCCTDDGIAYLMTANEDVTVHNGTKSFSVTVEGISLGRTSIRFKIKRNTSPNIGRIEKRTAHSESTADESATWWLPYEYQVVVTTGVNHAPFYLSAVLFGKPFQDILFLIILF